jgi:hypothetical protein
MYKPWPVVHRFLTSFLELADTSFWPIIGHWWPQFRWSNLWSFAEYRCFPVSAWTNPTGAPRFQYLSFVSHITLQLSPVSPWPACPKPDTSWFPDIGALYKWECKFLPVGECSSRTVAPHLIGTPASQGGDVDPSFTNHNELGSAWELVAVTDCCPLPEPQAIVWEWRWCP